MKKISLLIIPIIALLISFKAAAADVPTSVIGEHNQALFDSLYEYYSQPEYKLSFEGEQVTWKGHKWDQAYGDIFYTSPEAFNNRRTLGFFLKDTQTIFFLTDSTDITVSSYNYSLFYNFHGSDNSIGGSSLNESLVSANRSVNTFRIDYFINYYDGNYDFTNYTKNPLVTGVTYTNINFIAVDNIDQAYDLITTGVPEDEGEDILEDVTEDKNEMMCTKLSYNSGQVNAECYYMEHINALDRYWQIDVTYLKENDSSYRRYSHYQDRYDGTITYFPQKLEGEYISKIKVTPYCTQPNDATHNPFKKGLSKELNFNSNGQLQVDPDNEITSMKFIPYSFGTSGFTGTATLKWTYKTNTDITNWYVDFKLVVHSNSATHEGYKTKVSLGAMEDTISVYSLPDNEPIRPQYLYATLYHKDSAGNYIKGYSYRYDVSKASILNPDVDGDIYDPDSDSDVDDPDIPAPDGGGSGGGGSFGDISLDDIPTMIQTIKDLVLGIINACGVIPSLFSTVFGFMPSIYVRGFTAIVVLSVIIGIVKMIRG